jgi:hypothetical protein
MDYLNLIFDQTMLPAGQHRLCGYSFSHTVLFYRQHLSYKEYQLEPSDHLLQTLKVLTKSLPLKSVE